MSERTVPKLPKWPFFLGDILLVTLAYLILGAAYAHGKWPMNTWQNLWCVLSLSLGCVLGVLPFLLEYRAAMKLTEADRLTNAVLQIENLEIIGRQITNATANWQTAHEHSIQAVETAREIAEGITAEARAFSEFLQKANDTEKNHLRLEVDKLRRSEGEWLQILVRILDHIYALYQAAVRSGQSNLVEQLGLFQDSCRDVARRVGLVPFTAIPGESYDSKLHQLADSGAVPAAEARVAETVANGYSFQGQLVRPALVTLQPGESPEPSTPDAFPASAGDENRTQSSTAEENSSPNPPGTETEGEVSATPPEEAAQTPTGNAESAQEFAHQESPDSDEEQFRS